MGLLLLDYDFQDPNENPDLEQIFSLNPVALKKAKTP